MGELLSLEQQFLQWAESKGLEHEAPGFDYATSESLRTFKAFLAGAVAERKAILAIIAAANEAAASRGDDTLDDIEDRIRQRGEEQTNG